MAQGSRTLAPAVPALRLGLSRAGLLAFASEWWGLGLAALFGLLVGLDFARAPAILAPAYDDSYITLNFARNLAEHAKLSFDGESWSTGATSPLHVVILAALIKLGFSPVFAGIGFGVLSHTTLAASVYLLSWSIFKSRLAAVLAGLAIAVTGYAAIDVGNSLETGLFMTLVSLTMASYLLWRSPGGRALTGLLLGLAVLTRPEGIVLMPAVLVYHWLDRGEDARFGAFVREAAVLAVPALLALAALNLYALAVDGTLGGTANAKLRFFQENLFPFQEKMTIVGDVIGRFAGQIVPLVAFAAFAPRRKEPLLFALFWVPVIVAYALLFPGGLSHYFYRYQHPVLPLVAVLAGAGAAQLLTTAMTSGYVARALALAALVIAVVPMWEQYDRHRDLYKQAAAETYADLRAMAIDLNSIIGPNEVLATHDIGAVGYFADYQILDIVGLVNPKVIPYHEGRRLKKYIEGAHADYLLTFPDWDLYYIQAFAEEDPDYTLIKRYDGGPGRYYTPYLLYKISYPEP